MKKKLVLLATSGLWFAPMFAFAQGTLAECSTYSGRGGTAENIICTVYRIINIVIPVLIIGAVAYLIWGIIQYITAHDSEKQGEARSMMLNGIIALAVILGLWGLVYILLNTFGIGRGGAGVQYDFPRF